MQFSSKTVAAVLLFVGSAAAFSRQAFIPSRAVQTVTSNNKVTSSRSNTRCPCPACVGVSTHAPGCFCGSCKSTQLFSTETEAVAEAEADDIPAEVEALDGIESKDEAHNAERPSRGSLRKKSPPKGKPLDEFESGTTVPGKVKTITSYGAFVDIGAETDGLLHISQLSAGFVSDVKEFLEVGQELDVRIVNIDKGKSQIALSMMTEEEAAQEQGGRRQGGRQGKSGGGGGNRRDDSAALSSLTAKGWDPAQFVEGTVVSTVDFGAFVRIDVSQLNAEAEGEMDGLVHISALAAGRVNSVTSVVNVDDKVQVRIKSIAGKKVSLSMISEEDESDKGAPKEDFGAKDWKEQLERVQKESMPVFMNRPVIVDLRK